jgi:hypothetical protein
MRPLTVLAAMRGLWELTGQAQLASARQPLATLVPTHLSFLARAANTR